MRLSVTTAVVVAVSLVMSAGVWAEEAKQAPEAKVVFAQRFDSDQDGDGVADGLTLVGNPKITVVCSLDSGVKEGAKSQKLQVTASEVSEQVGVATRSFKLQGGKTYAVKVTFKTADLDGAGPLAFLSWYDNDEKKFDSQMLIGFGAASKAGEWTTLSVPVAPKKDIEPGAQLRLHVQRAGGKGAIWYGEFMVEETAAK